MTLLTEFRPSVFHRIFSSDAGRRFLRFSNYYLTLKSADGSVQVPYSQLDRLEVERRFLWARINFKLSSGSQEWFGWITHGNLEKIAKVLKARTAEAKNFDDRNSSNSEWIEVCTNWYLSATKGERWVTYRAIDEILHEHEDRLTYLWSTDVSDLPMFKVELANHIRYMNEVKGDRTGFRSKCNLEFETQELKRYQGFFDGVLSNPLTLEQRKAVIVNEDAELVVAAAGSGKTTTIKSKVAYLVHKGMASPHQILVISFNKNVQQDLEKSLASPYLGININTFHALGLKILAEAQGQKPSLTELAESREKLGAYLDGLIKEIYEENYAELVEFFVSYAKPYRDQFDFKSMGEYIAYVRSVGLITLNGETVKSLEE